MKRVCFCSGEYNFVILMVNNSHVENRLIPTKTTKIIYNSHKKFPRFAYQKIYNSMIIDVLIRLSFVEFCMLVLVLYFAKFIKPINGIYESMSVSFPFSSSEISQLRLTIFSFLVMFMISQILNLSQFFALYAQKIRIHKRNKNNEDAIMLFRAMLYNIIFEKTPLLTKII